MLDLKTIRIGNYLVYDNDAHCVTSILPDKIVFEGGITAKLSKVNPLKVNDALLNALFPSITCEKMYFLHRGSSNFVILPQNGKFGVFLNYPPDNPHLTPKEFNDFHTIQNLHIDMYGYDCGISLDELRRVYDMYIRH
jgi:hypothetical protein